MSRSYKIHNREGIYFISFATVGWVDVFTRREYKEVLIDSLRYCIAEKELELFSWCIMTNHVHLIARSKEGYELTDILRDLKKFTSRQILKTILEHPQESRKEMFKKAGAQNSNNKHHQFRRAV